MNYQLERVDRENFGEYKKFTFSRYRNAFSTPIVKEEYLGIGVLVGSIPVGLILGKPKADYPENMMIVSIFVIAGQRRKGLATALFDQFEMEVRQKGYQCLALRCIDDRESIAYIARIIERSGWKPLEVSDYIYKCRVADFKHDWLNRFQMKKSYSDCNLTELTEAEKAYLRKGCRVWYPAGFSPFLEENEIIPEMTLFLKYQGEIIGWFSTSRVSSETLAYRSVFVKKEFQGSGVMVPLMVKANRMHFESSEQFPYAAFQVAVTNKMMEKIITKSIIEFISITEKLVSYKMI